MRDRGAESVRDAVQAETRLPEGSEPREACRHRAAGVGERRIAVAESLTGGNIAAQLSRAPNSGEWFRGGIVAYHEQVKHGLLQVPPGPVVSETSARWMASSTAELLGADMVVAVTGEAGPQGQERSPGTVWFGVYDRGEVTASKSEFDGEPEQIVADTAIGALRIFVEHVCPSTSG